MAIKIISSNFSSNIALQSPETLVRLIFLKAGDCLMGLSPNGVFASF